MKRDILRNARRGCVPVLLLLCLMPTAPAADLVYGKVSGGGFNPKKDKFQVGGLTVQADEHGEYRIVLDPGTYTVTFRDKCATIVGDSGPIRQDIVFKNCKN